MVLLILGSNFSGSITFGAFLSTVAPINSVAASFLVLNLVSITLVMTAKF